jgi:hypothetical protein
MFFRGQMIGKGTGGLEATTGRSKMKLKLTEKTGHFDRMGSSTANINAAIDLPGRITLIVQVV